MPLEHFIERKKIPSSYARVLFDYTASDEHELSLKEAQVIQLMSAIDSDGFYIARDSVFNFLMPEDYFNVLGRAASMLVTALCDVLFQSLVTNIAVACL